MMKATHSSTWPPWNPLVGPHGPGARPEQSTMLTCVLVPRRVRRPQPSAAQTHGALSLHRHTRSRGWSPKSLGVPVETSNVTPSFGKANRMRTMYVPGSETHVHNDYIIGHHHTLLKVNSGKVLY